MRSHTTDRPVTEAPSPGTLDLDRYTAYEASGELVICDRKNPQAWIRSSATTTPEA